MSRLLHKLVNVGVNSNVDDDENRKTRILNIIFLIATPFVSFFTARNYYDGLYPVAIMNTVILIRNLFFFYFNYKQKIYHARVVLSLIGTFTTSLSAIWFHNGMEYLLLVNMVLVALLLQRRISTAILIPLNGALFMGVRIYNDIYPAWYPVPPIRIYVTMVIAIFVLAVVVVYYVREQISHFNAMREANNRLNEQRKILVEQTEQLQILNTTKEKLFSIVAHDMRSPISNLRQALALTSQKMLSKEEFESVSAALLVQVDQLQDNMMNLLHWSKAQLTGIQTVPIAVNVYDCLIEALQLFESNLVNKKIRLQLNCDNELFFYADPEHIKVVLRNVINNAIKFSYVGKEIHVNVTESNEKICIYIQDQGTGIPQEKLDTLFNLENTNSSFGTLNEKGTGLGLVLCKEFIEKNNGTITVSSQQGKGTEFKLCLPKAEKKIPARKLTGITVEDI